MDFSFRRFFRRLPPPLAKPIFREILVTHRRRYTKRAYLPAIERLEERTTPTTNITFNTTTHVLTLNIGASGETTRLSVSGTTLSVTSNSLVGTIADANSVLLLGFLPATPTGIANPGNIGAAGPNDVWQIVVTGADGTQTVDFQGGTFTAVTANDGLIGNVIFDTTPSNFAMISAAAPNADLTVSAPNLTVSQPLTTQNNGNISLTDTRATETIAATVTAGGSGTVTLSATGATSDVVSNANIASSSGAISVTAGRNVTLNAGSISTTGNVGLAAGAGAASEAGGGTITSALLTTSSATGTTLNNANTVASFNATNTTSGNISLTDTANPLTITGIAESGGGSITVNNGGAITTSGAVSTAANGNISLTATGGIQTIGAAVSASGSGAVTLAATGAMTVNGAVSTANGNVSLTTGAGAALTINQAVSAGGANVVTLNAGGPVTQAGTGPIAAQQVLLLGTGPYTLSNPSNLAAVLAANVTNAVSFADSPGAPGTTIATIGGTSGITTGNAPITIDVLNGPLTVNGNVAAGAAAVTLTAGGTDSTLTNNAAVTGNSAILTADRMVLNAGTINVGTGAANIITLVQFSNGRLINIGSTTDVAPNTLELSNAELATLTAGIVRIGNAASGDITVSAAITAPAGWNTLSLTTGGGIIEGGGSLTTTNLALRAANGIGAAAPLVTAVSNLAFNNTGGAVRITNTGGLTVTVVDGLATSSNTGTTTTLSASSPVTFAVNTTGAGTITATANETVPPTPNFDNVTVNAGVTVQSTGGDVVFQAGDNIVVNATASVLATNGNISLTSGFVDNDGEGAQTLDGTIQASNATGIVTLNVGATQGATQAASGTISGNQLLLLGTGVAGSFTLDVSATNNVATLAANTAASVSFEDSAALTVATVGATTGITTAGHDVTLCAPSLVLNAPVNAGAGTLRLHAPAGGVGQNAAGVLTAANLGVVANSNILLDVANNNVNGIFAANTTAPGSVIRFEDISSYTIGTVTAASCFPGASGITTNNGTIVLCVPALTITAPLNAGTGDVLIQSSGPVTQTAAGVITAANLGVNAVGSILLDVATNQLTGSFAASDTGPASVIQFNDGASFGVGSLAAQGCFTGAIGVTSANGNITLSGPNLTVDASLNAGTADVRLASGGTLAQTAAGVITGANLGLVASGAVTLDGAVNQVSGNVAANDTGAGAVVQFQDGLGFTVNAVGALGHFAGATGVTSNNGNITLCGAGITIDQATNAGTADVRLTSTAGISQDAAGIITAANLGVRAAGPVLLDRATNQVTGTLAANDSGAGSPIQFLDGAGATVGLEAALSCFAGATGVTTSNGNIVLNAPTLTLNAAVNAGAATFGLTSAGAVSQNAGGIITAGNLGVNAAGNVTLDAAVNQVSGTLAAHNSAAGGVIQFQDGAGFTVAGVAAVGLFGGATGVVSTNGNITLCGPNISVDAPINAGTAIVRLTTTVGDVNQGAAGVITAGGLGVNAARNIGLSGTTSQVSGHFAASATGIIQFINGRGILIDNNPVTALSCFPAAITGVTAGGAIALTAQDTPVPGDDITVTAGAAVRSTGSTITLQAGDNINLQPGSTVHARGTVVLTGDFGNVDATPGTVVNLDGTVQSDLSNILVSGGINSTFIIDNNGGATNDGGRVSNILSPIFVTGGGLNSSLILDDTGASNTNATLTSTTLGATPGDNLFVNPAGLTYGGLTSITLNSGSGTNNLAVTSLNAPVVATFNGSGTSTNNFFAGNPASPLSNIQGLVNFNGSAGDNRLRVDNSADTIPRNGGQAGTLTPTHVGGMGMAQGINYSRIAFLNVVQGQGGDSFVIFDTGANLNEVHNQGSNNFVRVLRTSQHTDLFGGAGGNDIFSFADGATLNGGVLVGQGANNLVDFLDYTTPLNINLTTGQASSSAGPIVSSISGIQDVIGGHGNNVITGSSGTGQTNVLIGGGSDTVIGGTDPAILFGGGLADLIAGLQNNQSYLPPPGVNPTLIAGPGAPKILVIDDCLQFFLGRITLDPSPGTRIVILDQAVDPNAPVFSHPTFADLLAPLFALQGHRNLQTGGVIAATNSVQNRIKVASAFFGSTEYRADLVNSYYVKFLGRSADPAGLQAWLNVLAGGATDEQVGAAILGSGEYFAIHGSDNAAFIRGLYHDLLGRTPSQAEVNAWLTILGQTSRNAVAQAFLTSTEYHTDLVNSWYEKYLGRAADPTGLQDDLTLLARGLTDEQVQVFGILISTEYQTRANIRFGTPADISFVQGLYADLLSRSASESELSAWVTVLESSS